MTIPPPRTPRQALAEEHEPRVGLRLRIWLACISGGVIAGFGSLWVLGTRVQPGAIDPAVLVAWLAGVAFAAVIVGIVFAMWLDHHVVGHLRGLLRGVASGRVAELRGLPGGAGWGELSELSELLQGMLAQQRRSSRSAEDLDQLRGQLAALHRAIERWSRTETWEAPALDAGPVAEVGEALARGFSRRTAVEEQNREAARQVAAELAAALADAQESAEQAERGFVEATAMLTSLRELQRLTLELQNAMAPLATPAPAAATAPQPGTREALEELVAGSQDSVAAIGRAMMRVEDVAEQVQQLANRATLIAIHVVTSGRRETGDAGDDVSNELKQLAHDVREASDRTAQFTHDIEAAVAEASERMAAVRARALAKLEEPPSAASVPARPGALDDAQRLLERVREMVQDAGRKGERLSAAGERASRAAERLARRIDDEASETEALLVRLTPVGRTNAPAPHVAPAPDLRLLEEEPPAAGGEGDPRESQGEERP